MYQLLYHVGQLLYTRHLAGREQDDKLNVKDINNKYKVDDAQASDISLYI